MADENKSGSIPTMSDQDYPGLFQGADAAAASAQKTYFLLQRIYLGSLIVGGLIGMLTSFFTGGGLVWSYTSMAIVLALGLLVLWVGRSRQDDNAWFDCRAIAESVKTATWRLMMIAPPFQSHDPIDQNFVSELQEIRNARPECQKHLAGIAVASNPAITDFMRNMRGSSYNNRKLFYIEQRLRHQKSWYSRNAELNARRGARWFWGTAGLQGIAVVVAIIQASTGGLGFNIVPILTTCAAVVAAWNQMKRHDELKKTYALASQELGELETIACNLANESDFPQLVEQIEEAISREHTMWCARRDVPLRRTGFGAQHRNTK
jgi:hypothetical protein